jgi:hypothetical protein
LVAAGGVASDKLYITVIRVLPAVPVPTVVMIPLMVRAVAE